MIKFLRFQLFCYQTVNVSMACVMKALTEMEDVIASMVGKDHFAIPVSISMSHVHNVVMSPFCVMILYFQYPQLISNIYLHLAVSA